jgi:hypothetical protein
MSKLFAISFSFLILLQSLNFGVENLTRINVLLEHAQYHQETYGDSFFEFLTEHYVDLTFHPDSEHSDHEKLPFKDHHKACVHANAVFTLNTLDYPILYEHFLEIPVNFYYKDSVSLFEKPSVFQPPKLA